jgi:hypothetical protein
MQQQMQQAQSERASLIRQVEDNHPGYTWDERQGVLREAAKDEGRGEPAVGQ